MLNGNVFYHAIIRKTIVAFGNLFSNIYIDRKQGNSETGTTIQRLQIPVSYSNKEKWIVRVEQDPDLEKNVYTTLPRIAFEITGYNYDSSRKVNKMSKLMCYDNGQAQSMYAPVPYNLDISLYVLTKTQEDAMQIIEQILPTFNPEYTLSINAVPDMNVVMDVPLILNNIDVMDEYDGDLQTRRFVTHTLTFTAKINLFGGTSTNGVILDSTANISTNSGQIRVEEQYNATGDLTTGEITETWLTEL